MEARKVFTPSNTDKGTLKKWFHLLTLGRMVDNRAPNYLKQALGWSYHAPYAGHDGIQLAIGQVFNRSTDHLFPYYRDMLTALSAGMTATELILNGLSKKEDLASGGRHMSNHFAKPEWNIHNVSSCTGNHVLHAVGVARAMKTYFHKGVAFSSQGESSVSEGYCYEAINGASREKLPAVFVFQDNGYGISVPKHEQTANEFVADNFTGFKNLQIIHCDGKDIFDSMNAMVTAREHALEFNEPVIVHAHCVRIGAHSNSDKHELYRDELERQRVKTQDPLPKFRKFLIDEGLFQESELEAIEVEAKAELIAAHKVAMKAKAPDPESIYDYVIAPAHEPQKYKDGTHSESGEEMKDKGGIFNVSKGMQAEFGAHRIFNAPIAEDFIVGTANGFSRFDKSIRVVVEGAEFADYFWPAMEQFVELTHDYWRSNGQFSPNVIIRIASGGYIGGGLYHSQNIEASLAPMPGVRVVAPAFADDAAGLIRTAMRSEGPTVYLEPKALYNAKQAMTVVPDDFEVPFGKGRVRREGSDLSLITYGNTVHHCLEAAEKLAEQGHSVEVFDIRSISPLDIDGIIASVKKTSRALVVHEDKVFAGFGGEIVSSINEHAFEYLDAPVKRVGSTFTPVGFNTILEKATLPNTDKVYNAALDLLKY